VVALALAGSGGSYAQEQAGPPPEQVVQASDQVAQAPAQRLREVNVTAQRAERALEDTASTVTTIDAQQIERQVVRDVGDLFRYEPNVSVRSDPNRFGASGFNIRGLEDNRVLILQDGVRMSDYYSFGIGPFNTANRTQLDVDAIKRVEIVRGSGSTLYGSDALGGVVAFLTKDPGDYLAGLDKPWYAGLKIGYASADSSWSGTATFAGTTGTLDGLLIYTRRNGRETETNGSNDVVGPARTVANPQDYNSDNLLAKVLARTSDRNLFRFTVEQYQMDSSIDVLSLNASTPTTTSLTGDDTSRRLRFALDQEYRAERPGALTSFKWTLYYQDASTYQLSDEVRGRTSATCSGVTFGASRCTIPRQFQFDQSTYGLVAQAESTARWGSTAHTFLYGIDAYTTETSSLRDATRINTTLGTSSKNIAGDNFPVRDFPTSDTRQVGVFLQDEILFAEGRASLIPGLRYDSYHLDVKPDPIYLANVPPGQRAQDYSDSQWSPKLGAIWRFTPQTQGYAQLATGFRAPPYAELNSAFRNPIQSYVLIPSPNLSSETSRGIEVGARGRYARASYDVAAFYNRYKDFIDPTVQLRCPADPRCVPGFLATFTAVNRANVEIYGIEARGQVALSPAFAITGSVGYTKGEDLDLDTPLNSVPPLKGVVGLAYTGPSERYGGAFTTTMVAAKTDVDETAAPVFKTPGFTIFDLTAWWQPLRKLTINAGLFNLFDKKYWLWSDLWRTGLTSASPGIDRYTQPGRNLAVTMKLEF
jgi:hemoglobin/transferrin/lactoferrin receptor protein